MSTTTDHLRVESVRKHLREIDAELSEYKRAIREKRWARAFGCLNQAHEIMLHIVEQPQWESSLDG